MIVEERLPGGIQRCFDRKAAVQAHRFDVTDHDAALFQSRAQRAFAARIQTALRVELLHHNPQSLPDDDFAPSARRQFTTHHRDAGFRRKHIDSGRLHNRRNRPSGRHADSTPRGPVNRDAAAVRARAPEIRNAFAEQIVCRAIVRLAGIAEPAGHGTEHNGRANRLAADAREQVEPAVALHVED